MLVLSGELIEVVVVERARVVLVVLEVRIVEVGVVLLEVVVLLELVVIVRGLVLLEVLVLMLMPVLVAGLSGSRGSGRDQDC